MQFTIMDNDHALLDLGCWDHLTTSLHTMTGFQLTVGMELISTHVGGEKGSTCEQHLGL
jgi:hypothetical protein